MAKPKITKIKAGDGAAKAEKAEKVVAKVEAKAEVKAVAKAEKAKAKARKAEAKAEKTKIEKVKPMKMKKTFILFRPFVAFFRYLKDSWREIRQVRWPSRKATWKMVLAVFVYTVLFVVVITLLDLFFTWLFNLILGN